MNSLLQRPGRRRPVAVAAFMAAAGITLAGCAPGSSGPAADSSDASVEVSTELTSEEVTITIADETGFPVTDKLAEEFTKQHPNVTFEVTRDTFQNLTANAPKLLAGDNPPDLIRLPTIGDTARDGLLANLDPYAEAYGWDAWPESQLAPLRMNDEGTRGSGPLYQVGLGYSVTGIFMNTAIAEQLGIDGPPQTMAELEEDLATAKAGGVQPIMAGDKDGVVNFAIQAAMNQYADKDEFLSWMFNEPGSSYATEGNIQGAEVIRTWADKGYFPSDINAIDYFTFVSRFSEGDGLFTFNGNWEAANYQKALGDDVSFFLVPPVEAGGDHVAMGAANSFSVAAGSDDLNTTTYFLDWIHTDPAARQIISDVTGASPGGDPALEQPTVEEGSLIASALEMAAQVGEENGQVDFMSNTTAGIYSGSIIPESQLLVTGEISGEEFVNRVQKFYESEVSD
ncbi:MULTISPECIES: ABC transporter substrate-binding protein [unclassified Arthrobacter]|uniref:ABC transporter substrate-binding protein n=1 Tax=unclassified Arthrobacter TaxID=235627 RepID=UPI001E402B10|nr:MULTISPECIES: ABC transporter substrate-binding protein [unclassified Arthrobacter]MCC9145937.1 ABC transporter substrate-binding protein [Arthrobacter sp. zg-Y919]MDK1277166.1 ABC transporter substrate-binding protein [Arthrobacter sp. zg.Y919]WIB03683.1 ABC transporter substrate-binding protein [Arthrobacter sp. zg-Y919]